MKHYYFLLSLSLLLISVGITAQAQQSAAVPEFVSEHLDQYVLDALADWNLPGVAVADRKSVV